MYNHKYVKFMFLFVVLAITAFRILCLLLGAIQVFKVNCLAMRKNRECFFGKTHHHQSINYFAEYRFTL